MSMNSVQNILEKAAGNYFCQLIAVTVLMLMMAFSFLELDTSNVKFVYANF